MAVGNTVCLQPSVLPSEKLSGTSADEKKSNCALDKKKVNSTVGFFFLQYKKGTLFYSHWDMTPVPGEHKNETRGGRSLVPCH